MKYKCTIYMLIVVYLKSHYIQLECIEKTNYYIFFDISLNIFWSIKNHILLYIYKNSTS
jgi:hypothetical protein